MVTILKNMAWVQRDDCMDNGYYITEFKCKCKIKMQNRARGLCVTGYNPCHKHCSRCRLLKKLIAKGDKGYKMTLNFHLKNNNHWMDGTQP